MLFNSSTGDLGKDLPFDFDRHRASPYLVTGKSDKSGKSILRELLFTAIKSIIDNNPERASDQKELSAEAKKKIRDISNIKWALSTLYLPTLDQHILDSPHMLLDTVLHFWEGYNGVISNSLFHLYNNELENAFRGLHEAWNVSVRYYQQYYHSNINGSAHIFSNPGDAPFTDNQQNAWDKIVEANSKMREQINTILNIVRNNYLDVDIDETNLQAWREYVDFKKQQAADLE
jgi:hypothetical protein